MRIGLISTGVPFAGGGSRLLVGGLHEELVARGHRVELLHLPFLDVPDELLPQMAALRMMRLDDYFERVITFPQAHAVRHRCKIVWFAHSLHISTDHKNPVAAALTEADTAALGEAHRVFTISRAAGDRLRRFNGVESELLYPLAPYPELFRTGPYGDEIVVICRMAPHRRQLLMIDAVAQTRSPIRIRFCGTEMVPGYAEILRDAASRHGITSRVTIEARWITEEEKAARLEHALAVAYLPSCEEGDVYPAIEAAYARRCTVTVADTGGVTEFVRDGVTGLVTAPEPAALAAAFDRLYADRALAAQLGEAAAAQAAALGTSWDAVLEKLLS
jgi:glycosyltransferase involved in cell wall biosynthesis